MAARKTKMMAQKPKNGIKQPKVASPEGQWKVYKPSAEALLGNQFWKMRSRHGVRPIFPEGPEGAAMLLEACQDYFQWCSDNPLLEAKLVSYEGQSTLEEIPKMRVYTLNGLTLFIDVTDRQWREWRTTRQDLLPVIEWAEKTIYDNKFTGATAGLLNPTIISRDLGLADKTELTGPGGGPVQSINSNMTAKEAADLYAQTRDKGKK